MNILNANTGTRRYQLRRSGGQFRPDLSPPKTAAETKTYGEAMKPAEQAQAWLDQLEEHMESMKELDGSEKDLNEKEGVVSIYEDRGNGYSASALSFDVETGKVESYSAQQTFEHFNTYLQDIPGSPTGRWEQAISETYQQGQVSQSLDWTFQVDEAMSYHGDYNLTQQSEGKWTLEERVQNNISQD